MSMSSCLESVFVGALVAIAAAPAIADDPPGAKRTLRFTVTYTAKAGASSIHHVFKGSCPVLVGIPGSFGIDGLSKAEMAERDVHQKAGQSAMAPFQEEMKKCGKDMACLSALAQKMQSAGAMDKIASSAKAATRSDPNYVVWGTGGACTDMTLTVNDRIVERGMDSGEGGDRPYTTTRTVTGTEKVEQMPKGFQIEHDLRKQVSQYRISQPLSPTFEFEQEATGAINGKSKGRTRVSPFPDVEPPVVNGPPKAAKSVRPVKGGELTMDWSILR
ncbi:MAG: hypothetical protein U1E89_21970 [Burkholderiaceae bacterium]